MRCQEGLSNNIVLNDLILDQGGRTLQEQTIIALQMFQGFRIKRQANL